MDEEINTLKKKIEAEPDNPKLYNELGQVYFNAGQDLPAIEYLKKQQC